MRRDGITVAHGLGLLLQESDGGFGSGLDTLLHEHGIGAGGQVFDPFVDHDLGQNRRGGRAVAGDIVGLAGDFLDHLGAHIFEGLLDLDLAGDGHAVVGHGGSAEFLVEDHVPAAGAQGDLHGVGQLVDASLDQFARVGAVLDHLGHGLTLLLLDRYLAV